MRRYSATATLTVVSLLAAAALLHAQDSASTKARNPRGPSQRELLFSGPAGGATFAVGGVLVSSIVYSIACDEHDPSKPQGWFGPCLFPSDEAVAIGWYGGSFLGAAGVSAALAIQRGCPPENAVWRATLGAAVGVVPGLLARNTRLDRIPFGRQDLAIATPLLAGLGAYVATVGCRD